MISIVLYGRNDNYGYNLHKRAALSFNCMAEVLSDENDEILFVDYNTPDDFPTFPEAIHDTLTEKAKRHLRIFRVRPKIHDRFKHKTHLPVLEPVARNVAVRRSNSANRWILSTNTDMIFVPRQGQTLAEIVRDLPKGYYGIPRFELPETLWENFDRGSPAKVIKTLDRIGWQFHLNEIVLGDPIIRFDGPGDFQLIERSDLFDYHGFDESMTRGWHVDSNIAKRLSMTYPAVGELTDSLFGYHCDHTRQITSMHRKNAPENSFSQYIYDIERPDLPEQDDTWGCSNDDVEEISIAHSRNATYLKALESVIGNELTEPIVSKYISQTYDEVTYSSSHVLSYLGDIFVNAPPKFNIVWIGANREMYQKFAELWNSLGLGENLFICTDVRNDISIEVPTSGHNSSLAYLEKKADAFIFDFAVSDTASVNEIPKAQSDSFLRTIKRAFLNVVAIEQKNLVAGKLPRRIVAINAIHNSFEPLVLSFVNSARTPFSTRIRQGFVTAPDISADWILSMTIGEAGVRDEQLKIKNVKGRRGTVAFASYVTLFPGNYILLVKLSAAKKTTYRNFLASDVIKVVIGENIITERTIRFFDFIHGNIRLQFQVGAEDLMSASGQGLQIIIWSSGLTNFSIEKVLVTGS